MARSRKRLNRTSDMDAALFEALQTAVPDKNTGPEPDDILDGLFDDDVADRDDGDAARRDREHGGDGAALVIVRLALSEAECRLADRIAERVARHSGRPCAREEALRIALHLAARDEDGVVETLREMG